MRRCAVFADGIVFIKKRPYVGSGRIRFDIDTLKKVLADKIHEPYRKKLIYEYDEVRNICESIESYGFFISGSGSTLINILNDKNNVELIKEKFENNKGFTVSMEPIRHYPNGGISFSHFRIYWENFATR